MVSVTFNDSGSYTCIDDAGFGPDSESVVLSVFQSRAVKTELNLTTPSSQDESSFDGGHSRPSLDDCPPCISHDYLWWYIVLSILLVVVVVGVICLITVITKMMRL